MYLAIDIGATKTLIALFSKHGRCSYRKKFPTNYSSYDFLNELRENLLPLSERKIDRVVLSVPGIVQKNYTFKFGNLPWPSNIAILPLLKELFSTKISVVNDADLATFYESSFYSGKSIYLTFSTGIGGGIAKNGIVLPSSKSFEPGHKKYRFKNRLIEWEDFASSNAIKKDYHVQVTDLKRTKEVYEDVAARLTPGLIDLIKTYRPDMIIIGGAVGFLYKGLKKPLIKNLSEEIPKKNLPKIVRAKRPLESVIYGQYLYAKSHEK